MNTIDLNIENYDLDDILNLFKITKDFSEEDLKRAKSIVLKTHPDKSNLHPDYFRFYSKAYKTIYSIWSFRSKSKNKNTNYTLEELEVFHKNNIYTDEDKKEVLTNFLSTNKIEKGKDFNKWFNKEFEKNKLESEEESSGYGAWFKSNEDLTEERQISYSELGEEIEKKKQHIRSMVVHKGINELHSNFGGVSNLTGDVPDCYSSDLFSSLQYEDLHKAHTETVIPVTMEDYNNVKKFKNLNEYNDYRNSQNMDPLSKDEVNKYFNNKSKLEEIQTTERAYKLAFQLEESNKKQKDFWGSIMKIKN